MAGSKLDMTRTVVLGIGLIGAPQALGQMGVSFSVDFQGPTAGNVFGPFSGMPDSFTGHPIDEGSILTVGLPVAGPGPNMPAPGGAPTPGKMFDSTFGGSGGSYGANLGIIPGPAFGGVEVDALSYGRDSKMGMAFFSVDEWASGDQLTGPGPMPPNVFTEGVGPGAGGGLEAAPDVFKYLGPGGVPSPGIPAPALRANNTGMYDGNGFPSVGAPPNLGPALGLIEPLPPLGPMPGTTFELLDNLDALDKNTNQNDILGGAVLPGVVYYSMDAQFPDPLETAFGPPPPNTGTAPANGFSGGDVVFSVPFAGLGPTLYAPAAVLGLDLVAGFGSDDLDALVLKDDGALNALGLPFFSPASDFILFSVRRGSAIIGVPDSRLGIPIEEGDILTIPVAAGGFPAIHIVAEDLGLGTVRSGTAGQFGADDLDALDLFMHLLGDANGDMAVTVDDIIAVQQNFGNVGPADGMLPGDANNDGKVTVDDIIAVQQNFGNTSTDAPAGGAPVPEPGVVAIFAAGALAVLGRGRGTEAALAARHHAARDGSRRTPGDPRRPGASVLL